MTTMIEQEQIRVLREALEDMGNPIAAMKREVPEGSVLNPHMAVQMAGDPEWYKRRARDALAATATIQPIAAPEPVVHDWNEKLLNFIDSVVEVAFEGGDLDGGTIQEWAETAGLLEARTMAEPCSEGQNCRCTDGDDFPVTCYQKTYSRTAAPAQATPADTAAARDVLAERHRQIEAEGWTPEHDDEHRAGSIARAAAVYALVGSSDGRTPGDELNPSITERLWPWGWNWFKPKSRRHNLVRAGALILAEIERIDRAALRTTSTTTQDATPADSQKGEGE